MKKFSLLAILVSTTLSAQTIEYKLKAQVFDDGQKITAVELGTHNVKFNQNKLTTKTFSVHAKGTLPFDARTNKVSGLVDNNRLIKKAFVNEQGNIELLFADETGANTLAYIGDEISRNVEQSLVYQLTLNSNDIFPKDTIFQQGVIIDNEVESFIAKKSADGIDYQLFQPPKNIEKQPLIIWLHGNGEGGVEGYHNNRSQLLANRGAIAFVEPKAQKIFGGAYVVAPQAPDTWYSNYSKDYIHKVKNLINDVVANYAIDSDRIYLFGASAGGYMALRMYIEFPNLFAGAAVSAPALDRAPLKGGVETTTTDLEKIRHKPLWLVHAANDLTIPYSATSKRVFQTLRDSGAILTVYPSVQIGEKSYNGHWSWIYSARNMPVNPQGEHLFQWMAKQRLMKSE